MTEVSHSSGQRDTGVGHGSIFTRRRILVGAFFAFWAASISIPLGLFSAAHQAVLPVAQKSLAPDSIIEGGKWGLVHVLAEDCPCSRSVLEYLVERGSSGALVEEVILLDASEQASARLRAAGFSVSSVEGEELCSAFGSEGVPFFQVVKGEGDPEYSGAYFDTAFRANSGFRDLSTAERLQSGGFVFNRPVYGCATSDRLKAVLDPLGLK